MESSRITGSLTHGHNQGKHGLDLARHWDGRGACPARLEGLVLAILLIAGGFLAECHAASAWSPAASLTTGRDLHTATLLLSGKVLVAGGD